MGEPHRPSRETFAKSERNRAMYEEHRAGVTLAELARRHGISPTTAAEIVDTVARREALAERFPGVSARTITILTRAGRAFLGREIEALTDLQGTSRGQLRHWARLRWRGFGPASAEEVWSALVAAGIAGADDVARVEAHRTPAVDAAWADAEAVLPEGWKLTDLHLLAGGWRAIAARWPTDARRPGDWEAAQGMTPDAALRALAARLGGRRP